jgi:hypothetical protein
MPRLYCPGRLGPGFLFMRIALSDFSSQSEVVSRCTHELQPKDAHSGSPKKPLEYLNG